MPPNRRLIPNCDVHDNVADIAETIDTEILGFFYPWAKGAAEISRALGLFLYDNTKISWFIYDVLLCSVFCNYRCRYVPSHEIGSWVGNPKKSPIPLIALMGHTHTHTCPRPPRVLDHVDLACLLPRSNTPAKYVCKWFCIFFRQISISQHVSIDWGDALSTILSRPNKTLSDKSGLVNRPCADD